MSKKKCIGVDLDGTLLTYNGWVGPKVFGTPMKGAIEWVEKLLRKGIDVVVFTARTNLGDVKRALDMYGFPPLKVTNTKLMAFTWIIDDRAIPYNGKRFPKVKDLLAMVPWWE